MFSFAPRAEIDKEFNGKSFFLGIAAVRAQPLPSPYLLTMTLRQASNQSVMEGHLTPNPLAYPELVKHLMPPMAPMGNTSAQTYQRMFTDNVFVIEKSPDGVTTSWLPPLGLGENMAFFSPRLPLLRTGQVTWDWAGEASGFDGYGFKSDPSSHATITDEGMAHVDWADDEVHSVRIDWNTAGAQATNRIFLRPDGMIVCAELPSWLGSVKPFPSFLLTWDESLQDDYKRLVPEAEKATCIRHLRDIQMAKEQWARQNNKGLNDVPTEDDLKRYMALHVPKCPDGGTYIIGAVGQLPTCSIPGHVLPADRKDPSWLGR